MSEFYGVAAAIYETRSLHFATTVVQGSAKDQIKIVSTQNLDLGRSNSDALVAAFQEYLDIVKATVIEQREVMQAVIPLVIGWPQELDINRVGGALEKGFPRFAKNAYESKGVRRNQGINAAHIKYRDIVAHIIDGYLVKEGFEGERLAYHHRGFVNPQRLSTSSDLDLIIRQVRESEDEQNIKLFKARGKDRPVARNKLIKIAKKIAESYAFRTREVGDRWGGSDHRFIHIGIPNNAEMRELECYNIFHDDDELRQIFAAEFMRVLGINYNVALKCVRDQPSPPFADVVATYLADNIDKHNYGAIKPAAVMIKHASG